MDTRKYWRVVIIFLLHLGVSLQTLLNASQLYIATLLPIYIIMTGLGVWTFFVVGGTMHSLKTSLTSALTCKSNEYMADN